MDSFCALDLTASDGRVKYIAFNQSIRYMDTRLKTILKLGIVIATLALYGSSLHNPPFFDDKNFFERGLLETIFLDGFVFGSRWLPYFSMAWVNLLFEDSILAQRSVSLAIHLLTAFVLYSLVKQVSKHVVPYQSNERAALAAGLLFVLHPVAVYAVGYMIQRTILMATLFGLLSLSAYFDGLVTRKKAYFVFSALFYLLSAFSKEHAVLIPAVALALTPLAEPLNRRTWRRLVLPFGLFTPITLLIVLQSWGLIGQVYEPFSASLVQIHFETHNPIYIWGLSVMTQATLFFKYLGLMFAPWPGWMSIDMRVPIATELWDTKYVFGIVAFIAYGLVSLVWLLKGGRRGLIGFALLAPWLQFLVEFSAVRIQEPFVLYRSYLWMAPLFLLIPAATGKLSDAQFWSIVLIIALAFVVASSDRLKTFSGNYALWDDAVRKLPDERAMGSARTYSNRAAWNIKRGAFQDAIEDSTRALNVNPQFRDAYQNRSWAHVKLGEHEAALRDANTLIYLYPQDPKVYTVRAGIYRNMGNLELAIADYKHACQQKSTEACVALAIISERKEPRVMPREINLIE